VNEHEAHLLSSARITAFRAALLEPEDLVQETFLRFLSQVRKYPSRPQTFLNVYGYLCAIMRNAVVEGARFVRRSSASCH
jgi:DNA-directed RNA polymerase specialized sigma24 family protein